MSHRSLISTCILLLSLGGAVQAETTSDGGTGGAPGTPGAPAPAGVPAPTTSGDPAPTTPPATTPPQKPKPPGVQLRGSITDIDKTGEKLTVLTSGKNPDSITITVTEKTKIRIDKQPATFADLAVGDVVRGRMTPDDVALMINVKHDPAATPAAGATGAGAGTAGAGTAGTGAGSSTAGAGSSGTTPAGTTAGATDGASGGTAGKP